MSICDENLKNVRVIFSSVNVGVHKVVWVLSIDILSIPTNEPSH